MYKLILVPLDGSARAERILPYVEELAQKFGSKLLLLQIVEPLVTGVSPYDAGSMFVAEEIDRRSTISIAVTDRELYITIGAQTWHTTLVEHQLETA